MAYGNGFGVSFQPGAQDGQSQQPVQQAIQLLSLRLPSVVGARALAPQALLQSQGGSALGAQGSPDAALALLQRLLEQSRAQTPPQMGGGGQSDASNLLNILTGGGRGPDTYAGGMDRENDQNRPPRATAPPAPLVPAPAPPRIIPGDRDRPRGSGVPEEPEPATEYISIGQRKRAGGGVLD